MKQFSSVTEVVDWLNKNSLSHARIGLVHEGPESYLDGSDPAQSMTLNFARPSEALYFSSGFTLAGLDGCRLTLKIDQVKILNEGALPQMSFARFLMDGKKGEKRLTPQAAVLVIPLDQLSYKGGKSPRRYTKDPATVKRLGGVAN